MYTFTDGNVMAFRNFYYYPHDPNQMCVREYISSQPSIGYTYRWVHTDCDSGSRHLICKKPSGEDSLLSKLYKCIHNRYGLCSTFYFLPFMFYIYSFIKQTKNTVSILCIYLGLRFLLYGDGFNCRYLNNSCIFV